MANWRGELAALLGRDGFRTALPDRLTYAYDATGPISLPEAVALPRDAEQVAQVLRVAHRCGVPVTPRGAGSNLSGGSITEGGLVLGLARLNRILKVDPVERRAVVQPGVANLDLQEAVRPHGLMFAPDPASHRVSTLGGNAAENAGGPHCLRYGVTAQHVLAAEVVLADGQTLRLSRDDPYDLLGLCLGSEGTLAVFTELTVRLVPQPRHLATLLATFAHLDDAATAVARTVAAGVLPEAMELMDGVAVNIVEEVMAAGFPAAADAVLLIELGAADRRELPVEQIMAICRGAGAAQVVAEEEAVRREALWAGRRSAYACFAKASPAVVIQDVTVPRDRLPEMIRRVRRAGERHGITVPILAHAGDGNLHPNLLHDPTDTDSVQRMRTVEEEIIAACLALGGTITGEHGVGTHKREGLRRQLAPGVLTAMGRVKEAFDPAGRLNPGKLLPAGEEQVPDTPVPGSAGGVARALARAAEGGEPVRVGLLPELAALDAVREVSAGNLTAVVEAGVSLARLDRELGALWFPFRGARESATVGELLARGESEPACYRYGAVADAVLGLEVATVDGRVLRLGGAVMKDVAGYALSRAFLGSRGTLGVITAATLRLWPRPEMMRWMETMPADLAQAAELMGELRAGEDPDRLELTWDTAQVRLLLGFEGSAESVRRRGEEAQGRLERRGVAVQPAGEEPGAWRQIIDVLERRWGGVWRRPLDLSLAELAVWGARAGSQVALLGHPGGFVGLYPPGERRDAPPPEPARRLKEAFDPQGILNPHLGVGRW